MSQAGEVLTQEQKEALEAELAELQGPRRAAAIEAIATARSFGDLSENFEYHAAKNDQGLLEARIAKLRERLRTAVVVEHDTDDHVGPGSIVELHDEQGESMEVTISAVGGVSPDSPLGRALMGTGVGAVVDVEAPSGSWKARVVAIRRGQRVLDRLHALNRGILLTPFHNMALMSPATTEADVDRHTEVFREAVLELVA